MDRQRENRRKPVPLLMSKGLKEGLQTLPSIRRRRWRRLIAIPARRPHDVVRRLPLREHTRVPAKFVPHDHPQLLAHLHPDRRYRQPQPEPPITPSHPPNRRPNQAAGFFMSGGKASQSVCRWSHAPSPHPSKSFRKPDQAYSEASPIQMIPRLLQNPESPSRPPRPPSPLTTKPFRSHLHPERNFSPPKHTDMPMGYLHCSLGKCNDDQRPSPYCLSLISLHADDG